MTRFSPASPATMSSYDDAALETQATSDQHSRITLSHRDMDWTFSCPGAQHADILAHFAKFRASLQQDDNGDNSNSDSTTSSLLMLATTFVSYLIRNDSQRGSLNLALDAFEAQFLSNSDVHSLSLTADSSARTFLVKTYFSALQSTEREPLVISSALFDNPQLESRCIYAICGGQGTSNTTCLAELRDLHNLYGGMVEPLIDLASELLGDLASLPETAAFYEGDGFDIKQWIGSPESSPPIGRIASAPISVPLIGLLSLCHYSVSCRILCKEPGELRDLLHGITGHSQGIVIAAIIACSDSWQSFHNSARVALKTLFWLGFECHHNMKFKPVPASIIQSCIEAGEGTPSPMLSVRGLDQAKLETLLKGINKSLKNDDHIFLSLLNSKDNMVIAGPPKSLNILNSVLRELKAGDALDQSRVVFNKRKPVVRHEFLPISAAFHCQYAAKTTQLILDRLGSLSIPASDLSISLYHTNTGEDLRDLGKQNIIPALVTMITTELVDWQKVSCPPSTSYVLDFGPGRLGGLVQRATEGTGVRVISASDIAPSREVGGKAEMFSPCMPPNTPNWGELYRPRLIKNSQGITKMETKMSRLLGLPPVMVAGMTPTTVPWDFVAAISNAGYHVELAGGGYNDSAGFEAAVTRLSENIPPKCGITCNLIYASPKAMSWQVPLIRQLIQRGFPIDGLTIGAGVPSADVVADYIETLGLKHISFKPGSQDAIMQVLAIARAHPTFSFGLQWTGGRGGGHHSFEDFHSPILDAYGEIRRCENIVLIAGSGFGGASDTYPYLTGEWSKSLGYPLMPFDGVLLGSRMMVAKEAHTSPAAKTLIVEAEGVDDSDWHNTYDKPTGGIITIMSEMGQPIHKVATRGVLLWNELDRRIFSISDKTKRLSELLKNKIEIIERLDRDFQKPWFAINADGPTEIEGMTYLEVIERLISLMYVKDQARWIDPCYRDFTYDFTVRVKCRLGGIFSLGKSALDEPEKFIGCLKQGVPSAAVEILHPEDASYFIGLCNRRGQKPVNFIPRLDANFETYFKKDSLWQAEDIDAVVDRDPQRVCIIHGPVAARYSSSADKPAKFILDSIANAHVEMLQKSLSTSEKNNPPRTLQWKNGCVDGNLSVALPIPGVNPSGHFKEFLVENSSTRTKYLFPTCGSIPDLDTFADHLCSNITGWAHACFSDRLVIQGQHRRSNPIRSALTPCHGYSIVLEYDQDGQVSSITTTNEATLVHGAPKASLVARRDDDRIAVKLSGFGLHASDTTSLAFSFEFCSESAFCRLHEDTTSRNKLIKEAYSSLWLGDDARNLEQANVSDTFYGETINLTTRNVQDFVKAVSAADSSSGFMESVDDVAPLDICIMVAWKALIKPIVSGAIDGDLLRLLHRSNEFRYIGDATPLRIGDVLESSSYVQAVTINKAGKSVEVVAEITRDGSPVIEVTSTFIFQGTFADFESTFRHTKEPEFHFHVKSELEQTLLMSREWVNIPCEVNEMIGRQLIFYLTSQLTYDANGGYSSLHVSGNILWKDHRDLKPIGTVFLERGYCKGNPVTDFFERHGSHLQKAHGLKSPGWKGPSTWTIQSPKQAIAYSKASKDNNPIHTCPIFAHYAQLPRTVAHGMLTSAIVRGAIERATAESDLSRFRRYAVSFEGMVFPGDSIRIDMQHVAMIEGRMLLKIQAFNADTDDKILEGEAELEQAKTAYLFTGQGSQEKGMGMALYESSAAARSLWDNADKHLLELYGFSIIDIVRNDPKSLTVHFGGARGRKIRENYLAMTIEKILPNGQSTAVPIVSGLTSASPSYTFADTRGLLYSTQFAQPALTIMEMAAYEDVKSRGLIQKSASFAGHSLGEYSALGALGSVIPMESLVGLVFYRGLTMQVAMNRDEDGRTEFSMVAANPSRVNKGFKQQAFESVVAMIAKESGVLLEIVNFNVQERQYVCAGHLRALWIMGHVLSTLSRSSASAYSQDFLLSTVRAQTALSHNLAMPIEIERGVATIPLRGIDVPFHSTHLRQGIEPYRRYLETKILEENVDLDNLVGKFIPNVLAKPFSVEKEYVEEAAETMDSETLREVLHDWVEV